MMFINSVNSGKYLDIKYYDHMTINIQDPDNPPFNQLTFNYGHISSIRKQTLLTTQIIKYGLVEREIIIDITIRHKLNLLKILNNEIIENNFQEDGFLVLQKAIIYTGDDAIDCPNFYDLLLSNIIYSNMIIKKIIRHWIILAINLIIFIISTINQTYLIKGQHYITLIILYMQLLIIDNSIISIIIYLLYIYLISIFYINKFDPMITTISDISSRFSPLSLTIISSICSYELLNKAHIGSVVLLTGIFPNTLIAYQPRIMGFQINEQLSHKLHLLGVIIAVVPNMVKIDILLLSLSLVSCHKLNPKGKLNSFIMISIEFVLLNNTLKYCLDNI